MSFLCRVFEPGDSVGAPNGMRFRTAEEAQFYGHELLSRWTLPERFEVQVSADPVNYYWDNERGKALPIPE